MRVQSPFGAKVRRGGRRRRRRNLRFPVFFIHTAFVRSADGHITHRLHGPAPWDFQTAKTAGGGLVPFLSPVGPCSRWSSRILSSPPSHGCGGGDGQGGKGGGGGGSFPFSGAERDSIVFQKGGRKKRITFLSWRPNGCRDRYFFFSIHARSMEDNFGKKNFSLRWGIHSTFLSLSLPRVSPNYSLCNKVAIELFRSQVGGYIYAFLFLFS